jgi:hypothetical protein
LLQVSADTVEQHSLCECVFRLFCVAYLVDTPNLSKYVMHARWCVSLRFPCVCYLFHVFYQVLITSKEGRNSQVCQHANLHRSNKAFESLHGQKYACHSLQCRSRLFSKHAIARWLGSWIPPPPQSNLHSWNLGLGAQGAVAEEDFYYLRYGVVLGT